MMREDKKFDLSRPEDAIKVLDAIIQSLNAYLQKNKKKIIKNESDRSADIETIAGYVYGCFDAAMTEEIDKVLSNKNLTRAESKELPLPSSLNLPIDEKAAFIDAYTGAIKQIKAHKFKTGFYGICKLRDGINAAIDNVINSEILLQCVAYADDVTQARMKSVAKLFDRSIQQETYILFYRESPINNNIYFVCPLLVDRLGVCFKTKDFIEGKVSVDIKRDTYGIAVGVSRSAALEVVHKRQSAVKENLYFGLTVSMPREKIRKLREEKKFSEILASLGSLEAWGNDPKNISQIIDFSISYDPSTSKLSVKEAEKSTIINSEF